jgi:hypothetical protein
MSESSARILEREVMLLPSRFFNNKEDFIRNTRIRVQISPQDRFEYEARLRNQHLEPEITVLRQIVRAEEKLTLSFSIHQIIHMSSPGQKKTESVVTKSPVMVPVIRSGLSFSSLRHPLSLFVSSMPFSLFIRLTHERHAIYNSDSW